MIKLKELLKEYNPTRKATMSSPKTWTDNMWNASGNLLNVVYWLSSLQLKAPKEIKNDPKLKGIINNLKKLERQLDKWYDKTDFKNMQFEGKLTEAKWGVKGKYLTMPGGEISSIPGNYDRKAIVVGIKNDTFKIYMQDGKLYTAGDKYDKFFKNGNDLAKWLNKNRAEYYGIDNR